MKQFLKPNWMKVLITVIFMAASLLFVWPHDLSEATTVDFYTIVRGLPMPYVVINIGGGIAQGFSLFYFGLLVNLIFWYFFSCFIFWICDKLKKKPQ